MNVENNPRPPLSLQLPSMRRLELCEVRVSPFVFLQHSPLLEKLTLKVNENRSRFLQPFAEAFEVMRLLSPLQAALALLRRPSARRPGS
jgi:hypothetical protein